MQRTTKYNTRTLAFIGVMAAVVFAVNKIDLPIPTPVDNTRIHFGNMMCLLSGLLLGPVPGGLASGIGCFFFDLTDARFIKDAPFTFLFKFLMAWTCAKIAYRKGASFPRQFIGATVGALVYIALYLGKNFVEYYYIHGLQLETVLVTLGTKGATSLVNGLIAVIGAVPLAAAVRKGMDQVGFSLED